MRASEPLKARQSAVVGNFFGILPDERFRHNAGAEPGTPVVVTYSMLQTDELPPKKVLPFKVSSIDPLNGSEAMGVSAALAEYAATAGIRFVRAADGAGQLQFAMVTGSGYGGWSYYPLGDDSIQPVVLDRSIGRIAPGTHGYEVALHEIGHAVGLKHPHEDVPRLLPRLDNQAHTIMSYNDDPVGHGLGIFDKQALTHLYGAASTGTPRIVFSDGALYVKGSGQDDVIGMSAFAMTARLSGGNDTAYAGAKGGSLDGSMGNDTLYGGAGNDVLIGGSGDDVLQAAAGGLDTLYGARGDDRLTGGVRVVLDGGSGDDTLEAERGNLTGGEGNDWLTGGDSVRASGGNGDDVIRGGAEAVIDGGDGNDRLSGAFASVMRGGDGNDRISAVAIDDSGGIDRTGESCTLLGGAGSDSLTGLAWAEVYGEDGNDVLVGYACTLNGGAGNDTISPRSKCVVDGGSGDDLIVSVGTYNMIVLGRGDGRDTVVGFDGEDSLSVADFGLDEAALVERVAVVRRDLMLNLGGGDALVLRGAAGMDLDDLNFN